MIICSKDICLSFFNHSFFAGFHSYFIVQLYIICMYTSRHIIIFTDNNKVSGANPGRVCVHKRPIEDWGKLLGDNVVASAILDRLLHRVHLLIFEGKSYRLKASKRLALEKKKTKLTLVLPTLRWGIFKWPSGVA